MDNFDTDLILDLAAGNLPEADARAAEASLSAEGRAELAAQRTVLAAIAAAAPVGMTDIERAHLHRSVAAEISSITREIPAVAATPPRPAPGRSVGWMRWASIATAAAALVGVVAVGTQLSGGLGGSGDTADTSTVAAEAAARPTTTALAAPLASGSEAFESDTADGGGGDASISGIAGDGATDSARSLLLEAPPLEEAPGSADLEGLTDFVNEAIDTRRPPLADIRALACYDVASEDDDLDVAGGFLVPYPGPNGETLTAIAWADAGTGAGDSLIRLYDPASCELLQVNTADDR